MYVAVADMDLAPDMLLSPDSLSLVVTITLAILGPQQDTCEVTATASSYALTVL